MCARWLTVAVLLLSPAALCAGDAKKDDKPLHVFRGTLDAKDPPDRMLKKSPHKVHEVKLEAGKFYQIDLESKDFDAFLRVEDAKETHLAGDDNSGEGKNARLLGAVKDAGTYRLVVTSSQGSATGAYRLTVRLTDERRVLANKAWELNLAGNRHYQRGEYKAAEQAFRQALAIQATVLPRDHPDLCTSFNNLGLVLSKLGKPEQARRYLELAPVAVRKAQPPDYDQLVISLGNMGELLQSLGKLEDARGYFEEALTTCEKALSADDDLLATCLNNLGNLFVELGKLEEARLHHKRALAVYEKALPPAHPMLANSLQSLGGVLMRQGKLPEARLHLIRALAIVKKALPPGHPDLAHLLGTLGALHDNLGQLEEAWTYCEQALAINKKVLPHDHPQLTASMHYLGGLLAQMGHRAEGWRLVAGSVGGSARFLRRITTASAQSDHAALTHSHRRYLNLLLLAAVRTRQLSNSQTEELLLRLLEAKGISSAALGSRRDVLLRDADPKARALADQLLPLQRQLADLLLQGAGNRTPERYRDECTALAKQIDGLERELGLLLQPFALMQKAHTATPTDLVGRLSPETVLIEIARFDPAQYAAVLLWPGKAGPQVRLVPLGAAPPMEKAIAAWRTSAQRGTIDAKAEQTLRELLWTPLAKALPPKTTRLVIAPDGALALVPFEALKLEGGKYLIESMQVSYVSTGRDLMPLPLPKERSQAALVLSDPDYNLVGAAAKVAAEKRPAGEDKLRAASEFKSLPGFAREANAVGKLLAGQKGWKIETASGRQASEEALTGVARPRLLYAITHGFFLEDVKREPPKDFRDLEIVGAGRSRLPSLGADPRLRSGLALAGANKWQERSAKGLSDGWLTALEVENLDLWGTELVVLSACETGRGELQVGEGVLGLRRAFQLAGAQTVLASLWKVPDAETEQLMTDTLSRWLKGAPPHEALRQAQLGMIRRLRAEAPRDAARGLAPPLYWAGFVCHGR